MADPAYCPERPVREGVPPDAPLSPRCPRTQRNRLSPEGRNGTIRAQTERARLPQLTAQDPESVLRQQRWQQPTCTALHSDALAGPGASTSAHTSSPRAKGDRIL